MTFPVLNLTLAILRSPELGFLGFVVPTLRQTPFNSGRFLSCGERSFRALWEARPDRRTWIRVHLCAREAGAGRMQRVWEALRKVGVCEVRRGVNGDLVSVEGRMRRRRNVRGIVGDVVTLRLEWWIES